MDPSLLAMANSASGVLRAASGAPAGPSSAYGGRSDGQAYNNSPLDSSNWTVATGSGKTAAINSSGSGGAIPWKWLAVAAVVGLVVLKKVIK